MAAAFPEWDEVSRDPLVLPIRGHKYEIRPIGYLDERRIRGAQMAARNRLAARAGDDTAPSTGDLTEAELAPLTDEEYLSMILGPALEKMRSDNVPTVSIVHAAAVAHTDATQGREAALFVWERGLSPEQLAADFSALQQALADAVSDEAKPTKKAAVKKSSAKR